MNFDNFKDPLIISILFFLVSSEWFDEWIKNMFPRLRTIDPIFYNLMRTGVFAGLYWVYHAILDKNTEPAKGTVPDKSSTPAAPATGGAPAAPATGGAPVTGH